MSSLRRFGFLILVLFAVNAHAADLVTFTTGEVISATDINANFEALEALNENAAESSPNLIRVGNQAIVTGSISISGQGSRTINFPTQFTGTPIITYSIGSNSADDTWLDATSKSSASFTLTYSAVNYDNTGDSSPAPATVDYIAIGPVPAISQ